jgi:protein-glutamine gamma-glutamyltransferase
MYLERLLQINIAVLASLGTLLLSMGQRDQLMPVMVLISAFMSFWLTDFTRWFRLPRIMANIASLTAVFFSLQRTLQLEGEPRVLAIANLLYFLEIILMFQEKDERIYWQLVVLSFMQVAVSAVFNQGLWFGVLLVAHMLVSLLTMALLFMFCQWRRYRPAIPVPKSTIATSARWPLLGLESSFTGAPAGNSRSGIGRELFGRLGLVALGSLVLTLMVFLTMPRLGRGDWHGALRSLQRLIGYEDSIQLGQLHGAIENPAPVMRIRLTDQSTGEPARVRGGLYLRGSLLTQYGLLEVGRWSSTTSPSNVQTLESTRQVNSVLQSIEIEPLDRPELFCIWPFTLHESNEFVRFDPHRQRLLRTRDACDLRLRIELGTDAIVGGEQLELTPWREPGLNAPPALWQKTIAQKELLQLPALPRLTALAKQWDQESGLSESDQIGRARAIESKLRDSGQFQYSLQGQNRNLEIDPIEDFVSEHPRGHCEYFATALALMLRSVGIPSRVVVGFHCDEWHGSGSFYQVRQLHAHTWVEAYLAPKFLPKESLREPREQWSEGGWLRLDATPAGSSPDAANNSALGQLWLGFRWLQDLWGDYVMEMDRQRQHEAIYQPLVRSIISLFKHLTDPQWWFGVMDKIAGLLGAMTFGGLIGGWIGYILIVLAGLGLLMALFWGLWRLGRWLWRRLSGRNAWSKRGRLVEVEFYRRLETLLARRGLVRADGQTQREFAIASGLKLAAEAADPRLAGLPCQVVDAFYTVRFGRIPLDKSQAETVEQALADISEKVRGRRSTRRRGGHGEK